MRLAVTSLLPCSIARLAPELAKPMLLNWVSWPMLHFVAVDPPQLPERFAAGRYRTRLLLGGGLPLGDHTLDLQQSPATGPGLVWHDAGHSDLIRLWDHKIRLEEFHGMTRYTDEVDIHAGPLTLVAAAFAYAFYRHRQRRLNRLVAAGFAY
jgi:hypothetical protein